MTRRAEDAAGVMLLEFDESSYLALPDDIIAFDEGMAPAAWESVETDLPGPPTVDLAAYVPRA